MDISKRKTKKQLTIPVDVKQVENMVSAADQIRLRNKKRNDERAQCNAAKSEKNLIYEIPAQPSVGKQKNTTQQTYCKYSRRNTMDCALLNEMFVNEDSSNSYRRLQKYDRRLTRYSISQLRNSIAMSTTSAILCDYKQFGSEDNKKFEELCETVSDNYTSMHCRKPKVVESNNRYMSVSSRPIGCRASAPPQAFHCNSQTDLQTRREFHETFANLIKLGNVDRQDIRLSFEEHTWQTEVKDLIWLELQAWRADRTLDEQDKYLCAERQNVPNLLNHILNYEFRPGNSREKNCLHFNDDDLLKSDNLEVQAGYCTGCLSLYCMYCIEQQDIALNEVELLLTRLEAAEALYPSCQAMGTFHPIYLSERFTGRINAMCLWYNIMKQLRLKLSILGKILSRLQNEEHVVWPVQTPITGTDTTSSSSGFEDDDFTPLATRDTANSLASKQLHNNNNNNNNNNDNKITSPKVKFLLNDVVYAACNDTVSSDSSLQESCPISEESAIQSNIKYLPNNSFLNMNTFDNEALTKSSIHFEYSSVLYRKFIENILKSRGLAKSIAFVNKLNNVIMCKAQITLEKPDAENDGLETDKNNYPIPYIEADIDNEQIEELRRYGYWSEEYKSIKLPTYIPIFVFLSTVPVQFMHEFLCMRLESQPSNPNPLSLEQLMKELREGLTLALTHREIYHRHIATALVEYEKEFQGHMVVLQQFDETVVQVFQLYLEYIDQLVLVALSQSNQKSVLEKEWTFAKLISPMIIGMHTKAAEKFCTVARNLLNGISERLLLRTNELGKQIKDTMHGSQMEYKWQILTICRETQNLFAVERERSIKLLFFLKTLCRDVESIDFHREHCSQESKPNIDQSTNVICKSVKESFQLLYHDVLDLKCKLVQIIEKVQDCCSTKHMIELEETDRQAILSRTKEILHQGYRFGFEYHRDLMRLFEHHVMSSENEDYKAHVALGIVGFAQMWMQFVTERCERGRGMRPRWATQGLEFMLLACDPSITCHLNEKVFEGLQKQMDSCITHVIGITTEPEEMLRKKASPRTRKNLSPLPKRSPTPSRSPLLKGSTANSNTLSNKFLHTQFNYNEEHHSENENVDSVLNAIRNNNTKLRLQINKQSNISLKISSKTISTLPSDICNSPPLRQVRLRDAVNRLDMELDIKLRDQNLIGNVKSLNSVDKVHIRARSVNFPWHRGIKIGQGRFGKVYTAVNNQTGELMAMKEIAIYPGETRVLKNVAEELKILEGIKHENLVRYYGIEVHREELLIFMELCPEGTLEALVELTGSLPEGIIRRFTVQLLCAVIELHRHGIVHRDIKTANTFLVAGGYSLKLGDFGSAVKIQSHTTVPGELQEYVGTQAYMAPEVFTKSNNDGHGRAADIWSLGCVVVEMASGKRPWNQFDSNFQIMFKVGMGEKPEVPDTLSQEGQDFIGHCLQHEPKDRLTAIDLQQHNFCKYGHDEDYNTELLALYKETKHMR